MGGLKHRQRLVSQAGAGIMLGSTTFNVASTATASNVTATATISGLTAGAEVFVGLYGGAGCFVVQSACAAANTISACFYNASGSPTAACTVASAYYIAYPG